MLSFINPFPEFFSLFFGQLVRLPAFNTAASVVVRCTAVALYKQEVATFIFTVGMCIGWLPALVTGGNDISGDPFAEAVIEYKVFTNEF
jgi:hypothetical protein